MIKQLLVALLVLSAVLSTGLATNFEPKEIEKKQICPEGYHLECEKICKCVTPYPCYMDTYPPHVKKYCYCYMKCTCVPDDVEESTQAHVEHNNFAPTGTMSDKITYTYFQGGERVVSDEMPLNPDGPVIVTPGNFNQERTINDFQGSIKQHRIDLWRANHQ